MSAPKLKAPRGTYDVLGEQAAARATLEARARALLEGAGYERIETPAFEATELFARGVGESTDIVRKEMFTFDDGGGRSLTLRPEGTAPVCRAYVEHGMHKRRQPVKLWYLSSFFRHERAQAGRYRQFWQVGAEAIGSDDPAVDAESIALLAALLARDGRARGAPAPVQPRQRRQRAPSTASACRPTCARTSRASPRTCAAASSSTRCAPSTPITRARGASWQTRRGCSTTSDDDDAEHFAQVRELLDEASVAYEIDSTLVRGLDYYTRTVFEFTSDALGAQSGVGGGGRYDGLVSSSAASPRPASAGRPASSA